MADGARLPRVPRGLCNADLVTSLIEDYGLIGDSETVALVGRDGSIDWFCAPRFDSPASFAALLGGPEHGRWIIHPEGDVVEITRSYLGDTLILETVFTTGTGSVALVDFMPLRERDPSIVRVVEGRSGRVRMSMELAIRCDYGSVVPWVRQTDIGVTAITGPNGLVLTTPVETRGEDLTTVATFEVGEGAKVPFTLQWYRSHLDPPTARDPHTALESTRSWWVDWAGRCTYTGAHADIVRRSFITLKALTYAPTGGITAAPTTSLPEWLGGVRNWDYRYCWLRDATFTLTALGHGGYEDEALEWSDWLRRAVAGSPEKLQIMYGVAGERSLVEYELDWLPGYENSSPVRVGNAASGQFQLDVYGEVLDMFLQTQEQLGQDLPQDMWSLGRMLVDHVRQVWTEPDDGIWEVRGPRRHFVHSKVMAWVAIDRWVRLCETDQRADDDADLDEWRSLRDDMHRDICEKGYNPAVGAFTQYYGGTALDASCLMLALVGFLPPTDPRIVGTVDAIERDLLTDGFVRRYRTELDPSAPAVEGGGTTVDGLPPGEGAFLLTTFWLVDNLLLLDRRDEAQVMFDRLVGLANDLGLLSEEYDVGKSRMLGNFPQAFSHVGLILTAAELDAATDDGRTPTPLRRRSAT